jgi:hypothetical protein
MVGVPDGSLLKIPAWMTSSEAAVFDISENSYVCPAALILVCELIEARKMEMSAVAETEEFTLFKAPTEPRKGKRDEATSPLESEGKSIQRDRNRRTCPPRSNSVHGRGNSSRHKKRKGG